MVRIILHDCSGVDNSPSLKNLPLVRGAGLAHCDHAWFNWSMLAGSLLITSRTPVRCYGLQCIEINQMKLDNFCYFHVNNMRQSNK